MIQILQQRDLRLQRVYHPLLPVILPVALCRGQFDLFDGHHIPSIDIESNVYPSVRPFADEFALDPGDRS
jgi:hypothetical protein